MGQQGDFEHEFFENPDAAQEVYTRLIKEGGNKAPVAADAEMGNLPKSNRAPSQATRLVAIINDGNNTLFHTPDSNPYATVRVANHFETWAVKSSGFRRWLAREYYLKFQQAASGQALRDALELISATAQFQGNEELVSVRVAEYQGAIYLDLCDAQWRAIEITSTGWCIDSAPPVRFRRARGMLPLPEPVRGGTIQGLWKFVNLKDWKSRIQFAAWLVATLRPRGPYPILALHGEQGTAKTTAGRIARALIDPYQAGLRTTPRSERDLMITANNSHIIGFDNLSYIPGWLSDALSRLATGGGLGTRELYENEEEVIFDAQRPVLLNGIEELAARGDLLDRMIILRLPEIPDEQRQEDQKFWNQFELTRPQILGALLDVVSAALRKLPSVHLKKLPRMADFAVLGSAVEEALGFKDGDFMRAYLANRAEANEVALESSPLATELRALMNTKETTWETTTTESCSMN